MSKAKKEGWTFGAQRRHNVPPVMVGEGELTERIDGCEVAPTSVIVFTQSRDPGATRKLKFFCKKNALGWKHLEDNAFNVVGRWDRLLALTDQSYVRDFHLDVDARVMGASGAGAKPKRVKTPRFTPTSKDGAKVLAKMAKEDERHAGAGKPPEKHLHGDETLDKLDVERRREAAEWYKQNGLPVPVNNVGPDGKVL